MYLNGIRSLSEHYSKKYNKHIYIFGEAHVQEYKDYCSFSSRLPDSYQNEKENKSLDISDFIISQLTNITDKPIDFFLETPYLTKDIKILKTSSYNIDKIREYFQNCFQVSKINCKYLNIRFHYTDIRQIVGQKDISLLISIHDLIRRLTKSNTCINNLENELKNYNLLEYKSLKTKKDFMEYGLKTYHNKLTKNQENIKDEQVKKVLLNNLDKCLDKVNIVYLRWNNLKRITENYPKYYNILDRTIYDNIVRFNVCFMDMYLLSRMFRNFNKKVEEYSGEPKNIIIYVGDIHADNYRDILKDLGFETMFYSKNEKNYCLDITRLKLPLFNKNN